MEPTNSGENTPLINHQNESVQYPIMPKILPIIVLCGIMFLLDIVFTIICLKEKNNDTTKCIAMSCFIVALPITGIVAGFCAYKYSY